MLRLYANENFPQPVVEALRRLGHDVLTTHDAGRSGRRCPTRKYWRLRSRNVVPSLRSTGATSYACTNLAVITPASLFAAKMWTSRAKGGGFTRRWPLQI